MAKEKYVIDPKTGKPVPGIRDPFSPVEGKIWDTKQGRTNAPGLVAMELARRRNNRAAAQSWNPYQSDVYDLHSPEAKNKAMQDVTGPRFNWKDPQHKYPRTKDTEHFFPPASANLSFDSKGYPDMNIQSDMSWTKRLKHPWPPKTSPRPSSPLSEYLQNPQNRIPAYTPSPQAPPTPTIRDQPLTYFGGSSPKGSGFGRYGHVTDWGPYRSDPADYKTFVDQLIDQGETPNIFNYGTKVHGPPTWDPKSGNLVYPGADRPEDSTGSWYDNFFGEDRGLGLNMDTARLGLTAWDLYGKYQDRAMAKDRLGLAKSEFDRKGRYAAVNLANQADMINFKYANVRDWMRANDPSGTRYTRPTDVARTI